MDKKTLYAKWALVLFIVGILGTILIAAVSPIQEMAGLYLGVSLLLALIFGIVGWRHPAGKVVVLAVCGLMVISLVLSIKDSGRTEHPGESAPVIRDPPTTETDPLIERPSQ